jgi:hypothetical protein
MFLDFEKQNHQNHKKKVMKGRYPHNILLPLLYNTAIKRLGPEAVSVTAN